MTDQNPNNPEEQFIEVARDYNQIKQQYDAVPERLKGVLAIALGAVTTRVHAVLADDEIVQSVESQREALKNDVSLVSDLIDKGMITDEQARQEIQTIVVHEDYRLMRVYDKLAEMMVGTTTEVVPGLQQTIADTQTDSPSVAIPEDRKALTPEKSDSAIADVRVVASSEGIEINEKNFPDNIHGALKNRKIAIFEVINTLKSGEKITAKDLWTRVLGEGYSSVEVQSPGRWLRANLVDNDETALLEWNGKRKDSEYTRNSATFELLDCREDELAGITESEAVSSQEQEKKTLTVAFEIDGVLLGKGRGKMLPYEIYQGSNISDKDYPDMRKKALLFIAENAETKLSSKEIWVKIADDHTSDNFDKDTFYRVWTWLKKIKYKNLPLIQHKSGSPYYQFTSEYVPNIVRNDQDDDDSGRPVGPSPSPGSDHGPEVVVVNTDDADAVQGLSKEGSSTTESCANLPDFRLALVASGVLSRFNFVLEANGFPRVDEKILDPLKKYGRSSSNDDDVSSQYVEAAQMLSELLDDNNISLLDDLSDLVLTQDPRANFADFLLTIITEKGGKELLCSLLHARVVSSGGSKKSPVKLDENDCMIFDTETNVQLWPKVKVAELRLNDEPRLLPSDTKIDIRVLEDASSDSSNSIEPRLEDFVNDVVNELEKLKDRGIFAPTVKLSALRVRTGSRITGTHRVRERLLSAGLITRQEYSSAMLELRTVVLMGLFNTNKQILDKGSRLQKKAVQLIDDQIEDFLSKVTA